MNIVIFDTETTSLEKPFCYNIGYVIMDSESRTTLLKRDYVIEQVWHNEMLFSTSYYADKRKIYVDRMRARQTIMDKYGYITQQMIRDFKFYDVHKAYAHNSNFDERVFNFNCEWFKTHNPFDDIEIYDILGFAQNFIANREEYQQFCDKYALYTESGNYSANAETLTKYITKNVEFEEEHTALSDSEIEAEILFTCVDNGAQLDLHYTSKKYVPRKQIKKLIIKKNKQEILNTEYSKMIKRKDIIYLS